MEIALGPGIPTYAGGLGVLAGDTLRSAADLGVPMVGVTLLHRSGYFRQHLDADGVQTETPVEWSPEEHLEPTSTTVSVEIEGHPVQVRPWRFTVRGLNGHTVPVYLLDTALPENRPEDQALSDQLYGGDRRHRLRQEAVLGIAGVAVLEALGHDVRVYHMNEGHSALLTTALLQRIVRPRSLSEVSEDDVEAVRRQCVFTTHTPVAAGHDQFPVDAAREVLGSEVVDALTRTGSLINGTLNMTYLALRCSRYVNGVSMKHGEISLGMFPGYPIYAITNGVHVRTWTSPPFAQLFDRWIEGWRYDNNYLRYAINIPLREILRTHRRAKLGLIDSVRERAGIELREDVFTLGFARRATAYKRADLVLRDPSRLKRIAQQVGPIQVIYGGKAHPRDESGKGMIRRVFEAARQLGESVRLVYLEDYDMELARLLVAGVDLWLNTPRKPQEASGTSGMKAALNGVPSLSVLDGWWIEGHIEGVTGWSIPHGRHGPEDESGEVNAMYDKLERVIVPLYYGQPPGYAEMMRSAIALNGAFFNTQRMLTQYLRNAYFPAGEPEDNRGQTAG